MALIAGRQGKEMIGKMVQRAVLVYWRLYKIKM